MSESENVIYRVERKRSQQKWWVELDESRMLNGFENREEALRCAKEYKSVHKSDSVRISTVKTVYEKIELGGK